MFPGKREPRTPQLTDVSQPAAAVLSETRSVDLLPPLELTEMEQYETWKSQFDWTWLPFIVTETTRCSSCSTFRLCWREVDNRAALLLCKKFTWATFSTTCTSKFVHKPRDWSEEITSFFSSSCVYFTEQNTVCWSRGFVTSQRAYISHW